MDNMIETDKKVENMQYAENFFECCIQCLILHGNKNGIDENNLFNPIEEHEIIECLSNFQKVIDNFSNDLCFNLNENVINYLVERFKSYIGV